MYFIIEGRTSRILGRFFKRFGNKSFIKVFMVKHGWKDVGDKYYYYNVETGKIVGLVTRHALSEVWIAVAYVGNESFTITDERHLGQYINNQFAKESLVDYWFIQSMTLIEQ